MLLLQRQVQLVQIAVVHARDRSDRVVRCAVCLGVDKCSLIGVAERHLAENMVREVNDPLRTSLHAADG